MKRPDSATIPECSGVYMYKDAAGTVIYVGKARVLRRRVLSYFRSDLTPKTAAMMSRARSVEFLTTTTEKEAFLLEASLIKRYAPHYNILLRDDKQYALFRCDEGAPFPRLEIVRSPRKDGARYFGPFVSGRAAKETWKLLVRTFGLRRCSDTAMKNRVRPCLYHHMNQCPAPCLGLADEKAYRENVRKVCSVLSGHASELLEELEQSMLKASEALEFERAAVLRDQAAAVVATTERQAAVLPGGGDMDVAGLFAAEEGLALGVVYVRSGKVGGGRSFFFPGLSMEDAGGVLQNFLMQVYGEGIPPSRILLPWDMDASKEGASDGDGGFEFCRAIIEELLSKQRGKQVRVVAPQNAADEGLVAIAVSNAKEEVRKRRGHSDLLGSVGRAFGLRVPLARLECVDISHTSGKETKAGLVVFLEGRASRKDYRLYDMGEMGGDDCAALYAWTFKRIESGAPWPELLLIDGGQSQLAAVGRALKESGNEGLFALASIAKARKEDGRPDRRAGNVGDFVFVPGRSNPLSLKEGSKELLFLQSVRDASHHFSIAGHRKAHARIALAGELTRLPGIGPATARLLWEKFKSFEAMRAASEEEIASVPGIGKGRAKKIAESLRLEKA